MIEQGQPNNDPKRIHALDGLRGISCLVVLLFHIGIMIDPFGSDLPYELIPGSAAVMVFYVLSGVVLSLAPLRKLGSVTLSRADGSKPSTGAAGYDWFAYYPRRVVRLCIPLFAAVLLGVIAGYVAQDIGSHSRSAMAVDYSSGLSGIAHYILMQFDVLFNVSDGLVTLYGEPLARVDSPVWSMSWELWFSLVLPLCVFFVLLFKRDWLVAIVLFACVFVAHFTGYFPLRFAIMFVLGTFLAKNYDVLSRKKIPVPLGIAALIGCIVLIELPWFAGSGEVMQAAAQTVRDAGCAGLVVLMLVGGLPQRMLSTRPCLWLGKISYSMYLTHAMVVGGLAALLTTINIPGPVQALTALVASFVVAWVFWRFVEKPSIDWSHKIGKIASSAAFLRR